MLNVFAYSLLGICAGIYFFFRGFHKLWKKRLIQNIPTSRVRSIAMGMVELQGTAIPDALLTGPYTGMPCVFYHMIIERLVERRTKHGHTRNWVKEFEMKTDIPFFLKDDTGCVVIDPAGVTTDLPLRHTSVEGDKRYREYNVMENESIYILGTAKRIESLQDKIHNEVERRIKEIIDDPEKKQELDINRDMWIDEKEWQLARERISNEVAEEFSSVREKFRNSSHHVPDHLENVVIGRCVADRYFFLSNRSEKELVSHYRNKMLLYIFGGALLALGCLKIVLSQI